MTAPLRILLIRPSALGDVCRTVPVLASLRAAHPDATIDWIVQEGFEDAVRAHPMLSNVISFPRRQFSGWWRSPRVFGSVRRWARSLRNAKYDLVFDCQGLGRSGAMTWATRSPKRIGLRSAREGAWLGYNRRHPDPPSPHTVDQMLWLLERESIDIVRDMRLYAHADDIAWWNAEREKRAIAGPYAVLAPTSRWLSKRWPTGSWNELFAPLRERGMAQVVVIGAPGERAQVADMANREDAIDLVGASSVGQTMAVIRDAAVVVANDSAPLHMAVGFDRPAVGLFGPTDPARVGPYTKGESGCHVAVVRAALPTDGRRIHFRDDALGDSLMRTIEPAGVVTQIDAVLAASEQTNAKGRHTLEGQVRPGAAGTEAPRGAGSETAWARSR